MHKTLRPLPQDGSPIAPEALVAADRNEAPGQQPAPVVIEPLHTAVPGRARLRIGGLQGSEPLQHLLEHGFTVAPDVLSATASSLTGNLIVQYDPAVPLQTIIDFASGLLRGEIAPPEDDVSQGVQPAAWHEWALEQVLSVLGSSQDAGLTDTEVNDRLASNGPNALPRLAGRSDLGIFVSQFESLPVALLAGAAIVSVATGGLLEAAAILGVVAVNGAIGYQTESRSERTIQNLSLPGAQTARVVRDGEARAVPAETLVPGDLIRLSRGSVVPADARLVSARDLMVSEATLTGESLPAAKSAEGIAGASVLLAERTNMVYRGTIVTGGSGTAIVVATGSQTEVGRIQRLVGTTISPETPIQRQLDDLGRTLVWATMAAGGVLFGIGWLRGFALFQMARSALSLTIAAVPEGLPMVATTTLALGVEDMRKHGILARRLDAVETLASVQMICFDKTGTLTLNQMSVTAMALGEHVYRTRNGGLVGQDNAEVSPGDDLRLKSMLRVACLCSDTEIEDSNGQLVLNGSGTENALVRAALDHGVDARALRQEFPRLSVQHRSEAYRFMATTHASGDKVLLAVKGSPLEVLARCRWEARPAGGQQELTATRLLDIEHLNLSMAQQGLRVLGFAHGEPGSSYSDQGFAGIEDLTWLGLMGLADPVRPKVSELIATLHQAGLRTVMLTGDQGATARAVAEQIGLNDREDIKVLDAGDLERLDAAGLARAAQETHAFTRMSPAQKLQIVHALQSSGIAIAMVGDGVNDGPALRAANIGIALRQDGSAAARDVADIFLDTDDLNSLALAIERSRTIHTNIRKAIYYLLSTNSSEILLMLMATALGSSGALAPMQLLWINLISDVLPGIGLALEPAHANVMDRPPEVASRSIVRREDLGRLSAQATLLAAGSMAAGALGVVRYGLDSPQARAMTFDSLVMAQLLHALTCRSSSGSIFGSGQLPPNPTLSKILVGSAVAQSAVMLLPGVRSLMGLAPLGLGDRLVTLAGGLLPFALLETMKPAGKSSGAESEILHFSRKRKSLEDELGSPPSHMPEECLDRFRLRPGGPLVPSGLEDAGSKRSST
ncbi:cation-transporting P-type ATPase [Microvirga sp. VF16]|uniref:cation-translocating P-type ATPase n=1 Tax=Microvirga sp. VF16 TaxID=2807101 RepID=UPI00193D90CA|nr:cation-transporting P-type ATPase [Microvirga sp. VF16]QRM32542.1 cation-transporting P-type ATPase [Microvirga sp. VF16]